MTLDIERIQAICFDVDGTLSDTDDQWVAAFERRLLTLRRLLAAAPLVPARGCALFCALGGNVCGGPGQPDVSLA